ncbi:MAG: cellulase family glycosylhydrolase [Bacteroidota bacterium]
MNVYTLRGFFLGWLSILLIHCSNPDWKATGKTEQSKRWSEHRVNDWYSNQPWWVGTNFCPSTSVNQLEMWQNETFDLTSIDEELKLSAGIGMNTHRIFLHNLLWEQDSLGFLDRLNAFLDVADRYDIKCMIVLFDGVWDPNPKLGGQQIPVPYTHNSRWVQSPGAKYLADKEKRPILKSYVQGVISHFADDDRILLWDLFNEPENPNKKSYAEVELEDKYVRAFDLLKASFKWAREVNPSQPITSGVWGNFLKKDDHDTVKIDSLHAFMLDNSDVITFHSYDRPSVLLEKIKYLQIYNRPILCTEYLARSRDNTFENLLPVFKKFKIGAYNWGLVSGKTNTIYPWNSWDSVYLNEPKVWHHDIFRDDGTPYKQSEVDFITELLVVNKQ